MKVAVIAILLFFSISPVSASNVKGLPIYDGKPGTKIGDVRINPVDGAQMVWVPSGEFLMGSTYDQINAALREAGSGYKGGLEEEKPQRKVYLDGYWMYTYPVTVAQYRAFCKATHKEMPGPPAWGWKDDHPVVNVTWQEAASYAKWAGASLPTEAQWEKAARGSDGRAYPWGNDWDASRCANSVASRMESTSPVGTYPTGASPYGCMDMCGSVWQLCADYCNDGYYLTAPARNPPGPEKPSREIVNPNDPNDRYPARSARGGYWGLNSKAILRSAIRGEAYDGPLYREESFGFRCVGVPGGVVSPASARTASDPGPSLSGSDYCTACGETLKSISKCISRVAAVMTEDLPVSDAALACKECRALVTKGRSLRPPVEFAPEHKLFVSALDQFDLWARDVPVALKNKDFKLMDTCMDRLAKARPLVDRVLAGMEKKKYGK